jgi:hypothetical protein
MIYRLLKFRLACIEDRCYKALKPIAMKLKGMIPRSLQFTPAVEVKSIRLLCDLGR